MSKLRTFETRELVEVDSCSVVPGSFVRHADDRRSFGIVVGQVGTESSVLWSHEPLVIRIQKEDIAVPPMPRKADVVFVEEPDYVSPVLKEMEQYELREEYMSSDLSPEDMEWFQRNRGKVTLHQDGRVEVERTVTELPKYIQDSEAMRDIQVRRYRQRQGRR